MSAGRWSALLQGAARIGASGIYRGHCRCDHGTCRRCLVRVGVIEARGPSAERRIARTLSRLDLALDAAADARIAGDGLTAEVHEATAIVAREDLDALGVPR